VSTNALGKTWCELLLPDMGLCTLIKCDLCWDQIITISHPSTMGALQLGVSSKVHLQCGISFFLVLSVILCDPAFFIIYGLFSGTCTINQTDAV
jgi:hypothetical protein